uniref:Serine/threonine-protein kinase N1 (Trinotate prediction) n=1 Tax=Myxobolus squamalis TaxID=59785 RepID=A0A6B2G0X5_MYXSQ
MIDPKKRICKSSNSAVDIKCLSFFSNFDWDYLLKGKIPPPYIPNIKGETDNSLFEEKFKDLCAIEGQCLDPTRLDYEYVFDQFSYVSPDIKKHETFQTNFRQKKEFLPMFEKIYENSFTPSRTENSINYTLD